MPNDTPLTTGGAAKRLKVSTDRVRQLEAEGILPAIRTDSGQRLFAAADVDALAERRAAKRAAIEAA